MSKVTSLPAFSAARLERMQDKARDALAALDFLETHLEAASEAKGVAAMAKDLHLAEGWATSLLDGVRELLAEASS